MFSIDELAHKVLSGDLISLSKAITLAESQRPEDSHRSAALLDKIISSSGKSLRIGITGVPGVGKSTFIEAFGLQLVKAGHRVAVLSVDPSSTISKGSILGDKTRMNELSMHPNAFIRPSPSGLKLGGLAQKTRETILLCESAGFDIILIETVGVGQSEIEIKDLSDFVLLLMLAGGGDDLQGIKRGIMEIADMLVINKVDGDNVQAGKMAQKTYQQALHLFPPNENGWLVPVETISSLKNDGIEQVWKTIKKFQILTLKNGSFEINRSTQNVKWFEEDLHRRIVQKFTTDQTIQAKLDANRAKIKNGSISINTAINEIVNDSN